MLRWLSSRLEADPSRRVRSWSLTTQTWRIELEVREFGYEGVTFMTEVPCTSRAARLASKDVCNRLARVLRSHESHPDQRAVEDWRQEQLSFLLDPTAPSVNARQLGLYSYQKL